MKNNKKYILVADDEKEIRDILTILLNGEGYEVVLASEGNEVINLISDDIDLYILDVNMPNMSGFMVAQEIRKKYETPIIFLTAYSSESFKVMGFSCGADDYIVKPFSNIELLMRVRARLKRNNINYVNDNRIKFVDIYLDLNSKSIIKDDEYIPLTYTEFKILELLLNNRKRIFSLEEIYQKIWDDNAVGDNTIMVHIKNIRKKLNDNSKTSKYIKTSWGRGYYVE